MRPQFHLSLGVRSVDESLRFFVDLLGGVVTHRDPAGYANVDLYGTQLTLTPATDSGSMPADFHFGLNLDLADFENITSRVFQSADHRIVLPPTVAGAGTPLERKKMVVICPSGYRIELKGYPSTD